MVVSVYLLNAFLKAAVEFHSIYIGSFKKDMTDKKLEPDFIISMDRVKEFGGCN